MDAKSRIIGIQRFSESLFSSERRQQILDIGRSRALRSAVTVGGRISSSSRTIRTVGHAVTISLLMADGTADNSRVLIVITDAQTEASRVNVAVAEDKQSTENRLGEKVQDTVEDSLRIRSNDVAALSHTPGDRVDNPEDGGEGTAPQEDTANISAEVVGVNASLPSQLVDNVEKSSAA